MEEIIYETLKFFAHYYLFIVTNDGQTQGQTDIDTNRFRSLKIKFIVVDKDTMSEFGKFNQLFPNTERYKNHLKMAI